MAEDTAPVVSPKVSDAEPDMDPLEWAKKHIEIPEMWARLSGHPDGTEKTSLPTPVRLVERKTELKCTDYHRSKAKKMLRERAVLRMIAETNEEIALVRLMIDDLRFRLDDIENGRRPR